jgi:hypothetical protein
VCDATGDAMKNYSWQNKNKIEIADYFKSISTA